MNEKADYRVKVKVQNDRLLSAIEEAGHRSCAAFSRASGIDLWTLLDFVNLKSSPLDELGSITSDAWNICDYLSKSPDDLWSDDQLIPLKSNTTIAKMSASDVRAICGMTEEANVDVKLLAEKAVGLIQEKMQRRDLLSLQYRAEDATFETAGERFGVTVERARQITLRAQRRARRLIGGIDVGLDDLE